ncbi:MAG: ParA family protein [Nitrospinaceae bacterium]|jgi:cellulose biosynthesis protein BcsQ|nr:ParA family protein [Nitrospina sp.]MBT5375746.1 ParA family protein [Nitrospinaceae bacterium]MBT6345390.1 ParA family protein [Nitrospina sp.]
MPVISIIGPKGGIGKTTLSINTAAALTSSLGKSLTHDSVCLFDLDLRLPTISSILESHPQKTFYDLFETLANKTYQIDFLQSIYRVLTIFQAYLDKEIKRDNLQLEKGLALYKTLNIDLFHFSEYSFGNHLHELFLERGQIYTVGQIRTLRPLLKKINLGEFKKILKQHEENSRPTPDEYINYIEEFKFSLLGGEVPILGKRSHRKRINEPAFLLLFLEFINELTKRFDYVILDTPAGGVNHLSSLMNSIDQILFIFDMSNNIAVNGSIDALHSFIDYYEDFYQDYKQGRLTGMDKAYVNRLIASKGEEAVSEILANKKFGIIFNRCQHPKEISNCLDQLREYLDTLDRYETYKDRIHMIGMVPHHKIINITNNRGTLFYDKDSALSNCINLIAENIISENKFCPTLSSSNSDILQFLQKNGKGNWLGSFKRIASSLS